MYFLNLDYLHACFYFMYMFIFVSYLVSIWTVVQ